MKVAQATENLKKKIDQITEKTQQIYITCLLLLTIIRPIGGKVHKITLTRGDPEYSGEQKRKRSLPFESRRLRDQRGGSVNWRYNWC